MTEMNLQARSYLLALIFCNSSASRLFPAEGAPDYEQRQPLSGGKRVSAALRMARAELLQLDIATLTQPPRQCQDIFYIPSANSP